MQNLGQQMTGQEFGLHVALEAHEPMAPAHERAVAAIIAANANGTLTRKDKKSWSSRDFMPPTSWPVIDADALPPGKKLPPTLAQLRERARAAGMET